MAVQAGREFDKEEVLKVLTKNFQEFYYLYITNGFESIYHYINIKLAFFGEKIFIIPPKENFSTEGDSYFHTKSGVLVGINNKGELLVKDNITNAVLQPFTEGRIVKG